MLNEHLDEIRPKPTLPAYILDNMYEKWLTHERGDNPLDVYDYADKPVKSVPVSDAEQAETESSSNNPTPVVNFPGAYRAVGLDDRVVAEERGGDIVAPFSEAASMLNGVDQAQSHVVDIPATGEPTLYEEYVPDEENINTAA